MPNKITVYVSNQTGHKLMCLSFHGYDGLRWLSREVIQPPVGGALAHLDGYGFYLWDTVKVGVVYDVDRESKRLVYDLFEVKHGATLAVQGPVTDSEGVIKRYDIADNSGGNVKVLALGRTINVDSADVVAAAKLISGAARAVHTTGATVLAGAGVVRRLVGN